MASAERFWDAAEAMPRGELAALQVQRLRACVERLKRAGNAFYRERLASIHPEDLRTLDDLRRLPFTTKDDIRRHYPFGLFVAPSSEIVRIHASSGTTGKPTVVGYTRADLELWSDLMARSLASMGAKPGDILHNAYGYGLFTGGLGFHYGAERLRLTTVPVSGGATERPGT